MRYIVCYERNTSVGCNWVGHLVNRPEEEVPHRWWLQIIEERHHEHTAEGLINKCPRMQGQLTLWLIKDFDDRALVFGTECHVGVDDEVTELAEGSFDEIFHTFADYVRMMVNS